MSFLTFPSGSQKFVRIPSEQAYEGLIYLFKENLVLGQIQSKKDDETFVRAKLGGPFGVTVDIRILGEDGASTLVFSFKYRNLLFTLFIIVVVMLGLSLILGTALPMVGTALIFPLAYRVNPVVRVFLKTVDETFTGLEQEYARRAFMEERKRWQLEPKDTKALYRRLSEKHIKTWGNIHALEYKISEYERKGLTREEAIRKTAEEEGIY